MGLPVNLEKDNGVFLKYHEDGELTAHYFTIPDNPREEYFFYPNQIDLFLKNLVLS